MDPAQGILFLTIAAFVGILATIILLAARGRRPNEVAESPFAAASEGMSACPSCGRANLATGRLISRGLGSEAVGLLHLGRK